MANPTFVQPKAASLSKSERQRIAAAFLASAQWGVLQMRGTREQDKEAPETDAARVTMRVFAKGCPAHALREVMEMLAASTPVNEFVADGVAQPGVWHHRAAWWLRDAQSSRNGDATLTLFRDLSDGPVTETNVIEDGCGSRTTIRFVWDALEVEAIANVDNAGDQGFTVRVAGVNRDAETGLFSYYVTTTERKTQYLTSHNTSGDAFEDVYDAAFLGLRGTIADPTDDEGAAVTVPTPGIETPGTSIGVQWNRNLEDCTLNAQARTRVAKADVLAEEACAKDLFVERDSSTIRAAAEKLGHAPEASGGIQTTHQSQLRPDGKYDNRIAEEKEKAVSDAQATDSQDIFSQQSAKAHRSQPAPLGDAPVAAGGVVVQHSSEKTPGGLFNTRKNITTEKAVSDAQATDSQDIFSQQSAKAHRSQPAPLGDAPVATGGVVVQHSSEKTPGGLFNTRKNITTEKAVSDAQATDSQDIFSQQSAKAHRSQPAPLGDAPVAAGGVVVQHSSEKTPGGLYNTRKNTTTEKAVSDAQATDSQDIFSQQSAKAHRSQPAPLGAAPAAAGGVVVQHSSEKTPGGLFNTRKNTTTEKPVSDAVLSLTGDASYTKAQVSQRSVTDPGGLTNVNPSPGVVLSRTRTKTPGGLVNVEDSTITGVPQSLSHVSEIRDDQTSETTWIKNGTEKADAIDGGPGVLSRATSRKNELGLFDNVVDKTVGSAQAVTHDSESRADQTSTTEWSHNASDPADASGGGDGTIVRATSRKNELGLHDNTKETITAVAQSVTHNSESRADQTTSTMWERNAAQQVDADGGGSGTIVRATSRQNEFGRFNNTKETITAEPQEWTTTIACKRGQRSGTLTVYRFTNQEVGYSEGRLAAAGSEADISPNVTLNSFGKEDGGISFWVPDAESSWSVATTDAYDLGLTSFTGKTKRAHDIISDGTITTKVQELTFTHYYGLFRSHSAAWSAISAEAGIAEYEIGPITMRSGKKLWRVRAKSAVTSYSAWA